MKKKIYLGIAVFLFLNSIISFFYSFLLGLLILGFALFFIAAYRNLNIQEKGIIDKVEILKHKIEFKIVGSHLGGRQANIDKFINKKIEEEELILYENLTDKDIKTKKYVDEYIYELPQNYVLEFEFPKDEKLLELTKEPENEYDKNAIRISIKGAGTVGYVPKNRNIEVGNFLSKYPMKLAKVSITGGNYKMWDGEDLEKDFDNYELYMEIYS